jgi:WD40 repeat protein
MADPRSGLVLGYHEDGVVGVAACPDGRRVVTVGSGGDLVVWAVPSWRRLREIRVPTPPVRTLAVDGDLAMAGCSDGTVVVQPLEGGRSARLLTGHTTPVTALGAGAGRVVAAAVDRTLRVWSGPSDGYGPASTGGVAALGASAAGDVAYSGDRSGIVRCWETRTGQPVERWHGHDGPTYGLAVAPDGACAVSVGQDGAVVRYDVGSGGDPVVLGRHGDTSRFVGLTGRHAVSAALDGSVRVWPLDGAGAVLLRGHDVAVTALGVASRAARAVSAAYDLSLRVWDTAQGTLLAELRGHVAPVWAVDVAADGTRAVTASHDGSLRVWDLESAAEIAVLGAGAGRLELVAVDRQGRCAVTFDRTPVGRVWDLESGTEVAELLGHRARVTGVAFSWDGSCIVSASVDGTVRVWDPGSGVEIAAFTGDAGPLLSLAVAADGDLVVAGSDGGAVEILALVAPAGTTSGSGG